MVSIQFKNVKVERDPESRQSKTNSRDLVVIQTNSSPLSVARDSPDNEGRDH